MINFFLAIQFFTHVDECTHNLRNCAPNMTCVNEYGSFFCKGLPYTLLNNTNVVVVLFAVEMFLPFSSSGIELPAVRCIAWFY